MSAAPAVLFIGIPVQLHVAAVAAVLCPRRRLPQLLIHQSRCSHRVVDVSVIGPCVLYLPSFHIYNYDNLPATWPFLLPDCYSGLLSTFWALALLSFSLGDCAFGIKNGEALRHHVLVVFFRCRVLP